MDQLKNFTDMKLYKMLAMPDADFEDWLKKAGLLHSKRTCECGVQMGTRKREGEKHPTWQCPVKKCRKEKGYLVGTQFGGTHLTLKEVFRVSFYFVR